MTGTGPIRILVAEDIDILREALVEALNEEEDFLVVGHSATGVGILELAHAEPFDLILMDVEMETSRAGIDASAKILEDFPNAKIIFLTAYETETTILASMAVGPVDYVVKSETYDELFQHIRNAYQGKPVLSQEIQQVLLQEYSRLRDSEKSLLFFIHNVSNLTPAELDLIRWLLRGKTVREIAKERFVTHATVKSQITVLLRKFGCTRTKQIVKMIRDHNLESLFE